MAPFARQVFFFYYYVRAFVDHHARFVNTSGCSRHREVDVPYEHVGRKLNPGEWRSLFDIHFDTLRGGPLRENLKFLFFSTWQVLKRQSSDFPDNHVIDNNKTTVLTQLFIEARYYMPFCRMMRTNTLHFQFV